MTEEEIKRATCQISGSGNSGTGWLIAPQFVLTARHCVEDALKEGKSVHLQFGAGEASIQVDATVGPDDESLDVCLLQLPHPLELDPIPIATESPRAGEKWSAFGYPVVKLVLGHALRGEIQQVLDDSLLRVDLDVSIEPGTHLSDYRGLSGSALIVAGVCKGLLLVNIDSALGALSLHKIRPFLEKHSLASPQAELVAAAITYGARPEFDASLESVIAKLRGGYVFIEGSHGVGKSLYCKHFQPQSPALEALGVYALSDRTRGSTPAKQAQPEALFDWLNSLLSSRATGKPARLRDLTYSQLIELTGQVLKSLAERSTRAGKVGVLFIDGIDEAAAAGADALKRLVNLLPPEIPDGLVIVVTGVGLQALGADLDPINRGAERLTLPPLDRDVQYDVCRSFLDEDKDKAHIVAALCDRALGHPLYLRYLADMVNSGATELDIAELPVFSGAIEEYYETIWSKLIASNDVVNLLGIIARVRWGIPVSKVASMLTASELAALPSTLVRVRHLLAYPDNTQVYHPSFTDFAIHKTAVIDEWVHSRLVDFCASAESEDYGVLNKVYHGLRAGKQHQLRAIEECQQTWVDESVLRGVEPDVLLSDVEDTLEAAMSIGGALDIIRLLLLSQRLTFRYDVLFVQSAQLVASALTALGKTESAIRHIVRSGRLVVSADEAFAVANALTRQGSTEQALHLLELLRREVNQVFEKIGTGEGLSIREFFGAVDVLLHSFSLARAAGGDPPFSRLVRTVSERVLFAPGSKFSREESAQVLRHLFGSIAGGQLCLQAEYLSIRQTGLPVDVETRHQLLSLLQVLVHAQMYSERYGTPLDRNLLAALLDEITSVIDAPLKPDDRNFLHADVLIETGATHGLVATYCAGADFPGDEKLPLHKENRADFDYSGFDGAMLKLRAKTFLSDDNTKPQVSQPSGYEWEGGLEALARAVAWCDGKARRAFAAKDQQELDAVWALLQEELLPSLAFTLEERIHWEASYFIPEAVIPRLYQHLAKLFLDCFADKAIALLEALERGFDSQLGIYNEGFRLALQRVLQLYVEHGPTGAQADMAFVLVLRWRDYAQANVANRLELVPELLQIIPLLAQLNAQEEALRTYRMVLASSMGPSWYKEDQLSVMSSTLEALPATSPLSSSSLGQVAALLERASGEMTFQRYVRADKGNFIGQLCRRSLYADAVRYFEHQSCGTLPELYAQATAGDLDRVSPLVGMRYPGGALEEQAALLALVRNTGSRASWRVRWALLEVFLHGDERHLTDWGGELAGIINELSQSSADLEVVSARLRSIVESLNAERAWLLLQALVPKLAPALRGQFEPYLDKARSGLDQGRTQRLSRNFDVHEREAPAEVEAVPEASSSEVAEEDERFVLPGMFGKRSAIGESRAQILEAQEHVKRRNFSAATRKAIDSLTTLQNSGWSIWIDRHSAKPADELIRTHVQNADEIARLYAPLVRAERHSQRWSIATHLVSLVGQKLSPENQAKALSIAIDHVRQIVGEASTAEFGYMGADGGADADESLMELLLWALDHPAWGRRDAAASMVLWLARQDSAWLPQLAKLAVSMDSRNRADIAAATLDILAREDAVSLWGHIESHIDVFHVLQHCRHVGRLATFMRVAERASKRGIQSAVAAFQAITQAFPETATSLAAAPAANSGPPAYVPPSLYRIWSELFELGLVTTSTKEAFASQMATSCSPLPVPVAKELEELVAEGARERGDLSNGRWATTIRYALNTALFQPLPASKLGKAEASLRTYNPESLLEPRNATELLAGLVDCLESGKPQSFRPSHSSLVFLHLGCSLELEREFTHVEVTAHLVAPGQPRHMQPTPPTFRATELPRPGPDEPLAVCATARPVLAYFGGLSPAIATPRFLHFIGAQPSAVVRFHWRHGSTASTLASSRRHEAVLTGIERSALNLPDGWRIEWVLRVGGAVKAVLHNF